MKQVPRRIIYLLLGVQPALVGSAIVLFALWPLAIMALAGTVGLAIATVSRFPVSLRSYRIMSALLVGGLALELPFFAWALHDLLTGGGLAASPSNAMLVGWVVLGPSACALHALRRGRCVLDRPLKPRSLHGTAQPRP